jgi:hypothetical protein
VCSDSFGVCCTSCLRLNHKLHYLITNISHTETNLNFLLKLRRAHIFGYCDFIITAKQVLVNNYWKLLQILGKMYVWNYDDIDNINIYSNHKINGNLLTEKHNFFELSFEHIFIQWTCSSSCVLIGITTGQTFNQRRNVIKIWGKLEFLLKHKNKAHNDFFRNKPSVCNWMTFGVFIVKWKHRMQSSAPVLSLRMTLLPLLLWHRPHGGIASASIVISEYVTILPPSAPDACVWIRNVPWYSMGK